MEHDTLPNGFNLPGMMSLESCKSQQKELIPIIIGAIAHGKGKDIRARCDNVAVTLHMLR